MLNKKVMIVSLGCDKNLVDTEKMLGILADEELPEENTSEDNASEESDAE